MKAVLLVLSCLQLVVGESLGGSLRVGKKVKPVDVLVLTEALCPYCEQFLSESLWPAFQELGNQVMNVTVIPFGNARVDEASQTVKCQHGGGECDANTYELCAIEMVKHVEDYLPFLVCNAQSLPAGFHTGPFSPDLFQKCALASGIFWGALLACHDTASLAWQVNLKASQATPKHEYVPYVMLNGSLMADDVDFQTEVCRLYKAQGGRHPNCLDDNEAGVTVSNPFSTAQTCPNIVLDASE